MSIYSLITAMIFTAFLYYLCPKRARWLLLLAVSLLLYAQGGKQALAFILITTLTTWGAALAMDRIRAKSRALLKAGRASLLPEEAARLKKSARRRCRLLLFAALALNFGLLALLKVFPGASGSLLGIRLFVPLGVSFYTFQSTGYLLDVYNGKTAAQRNPAKYALFVSFFPQLIQGPIGRYDALAPQLLEPHAFELAHIRRGLLLMLWGFFKKKLIADRLAPLVSEVFSHSELYGGAVIAFAVLAYSLQQYADFSGGIDIVTGGAELMGVHLAPNFRRPYFSASLGEFWRRWHISLGAWMRDYVFYPFALTRPMRSLSKLLKKHVGAEMARSMPAALGNILVFFLVGIWHGTTSGYIAWGLYNGVILAASALAEPLFRRFAAGHAQLVKSRAFAAVRILRTFVIVNIGWFFDRSQSAAAALSMLMKTLVSPMAFQLCDGTLLSLGLSGVDFAVLFVAVMVLFAVSVMQERGIQVREWVQNRPLVLRWLLMEALVLFTLLFFVTDGSVDFMYAVF